MENRKTRSAPGFTGLGKRVIQPAIYFIILGLGIYIGVHLGQGMQTQNETASSAQQINYIEDYARSQYLNGMELEILEQQLLTETQAENGTNDE